LEIGTEEILYYKIHGDTMHKAKSDLMKAEATLYKNILVCVTQQKNCERLIKKAAEIGKPAGAQIHVLHVARENINFLSGNSDSEALEYLFRCSKAVGANLTVIKSDNVIKAIADYVKENNIDCIILGKSNSKKGSDSFVRQLSANISAIDMILTI